METTDEIGESVASALNELLNSQYSDLADLTIERLEFLEQEGLIESHSASMGLWSSGRNLHILRRDLESMLWYKQPKPGEKVFPGTDSYRFAKYGLIEQGSYMGEWVATKALAAVWIEPIDPVTCLVELDRVVLRSQDLDSATADDLRDRIRQAAKLIRDCVNSQDNE